MILPIWVEGIQNGDWFKIFEFLSISQIFVFGPSKISLCSDANKQIKNIAMSVMNPNVVQRKSKTRVFKSWILDLFCISYVTRIASFFFICQTCLEWNDTEKLQNNSNFEFKTWRFFYWYLFAQRDQITVLVEWIFCINLAFFMVKNQEELNNSNFVFKVTFSIRRHIGDPPTPIGRHNDFDSKH